MIRVDPNPRLVWLMNYALNEVEAQLLDKDKYDKWIRWASAWRDGKRSPAACVEVARHCFEHKESATWHCLGQLAWGAKEACYNIPKSGWLVLRYIADAMVAFNVAFPEDSAEFPPESPLPRLKDVSYDDNHQYSRGALS